MKNRKRSILCLALALIIAMSLLPASVFAADKAGVITVHTLKQNKWVTAKGCYEGSDKKPHYHVYKISVPKHGYCTIYMNNDKADSSIRHRTYLYEKLPKSGVLLIDGDVTESLSGTKRYISLEHGTYYLYAGKGAKLKWKFNKKSHPSNYCQSKASSLSAGKTKKVYFDYQYEYPVWFKIKLKKSKKITVTVDCLDEGFDPNFVVMNSKGIPVKVSEADWGVWNTGKLAKGTYYIRLERNTEYYGDYSHLYMEGRYVSVSWK